MRGETLEQAADPESGAALIGSQRRNFVFVAVLLGMLLAALDQTVVATVVVADLGGAGHQSWVVTSYLLVSTIVTAAALIGEVIPLRDRGRYQGALGAARRSVASSPTISRGGERSGSMCRSG